MRLGHQERDEGSHKPFRYETEYDTPQITRTILVEMDAVEFRYLSWRVVHFSLIARAYRKIHQP